MFELFDDNAANAFVEVIKESRVLKSRITSPSKLNRLRTLANIVSEKVSASFSEKGFLELLIESSKEKEFFEVIR